MFIWEKGISDMQAGQYHGRGSFFNFSYFRLLISTQLIWFHLSHRSHWTESSLSLTSSLQTPQGYCYVIEGRQVDIQAVFKCNRKKYKSKTKKRKETNSAQHKAKYLSLFKFGLEKSPSSAYSVYLLMYVSSIFVLGICC